MSLLLLLISSSASSFRCSTCTLESCDGVRILVENPECQGSLICFRVGAVTAATRGRSQRGIMILVRPLDRACLRSPFSECL